MNGGSSDADRFGIDGGQTSGSSISLVNQKFNFLSIISSFFPILSLSTWEIMFNLREKENVPQVLEKLLFVLCRHPHWSSCRQLLNLVKSMSVVNSCENLKLQCSSILDGICCLVGSLLQLDGVVIHKTVCCIFLYGKGVRRVLDFSWSFGD